MQEIFKPKHMDSIRLINLRHRLKYPKKKCLLTQLKPLVKIIEISG